VAQNQGSCKDSLVAGEGGRFKPRLSSDSSGDGFSCPDDPKL